MSWGYGGYHDGYGERRVKAKCAECGGKTAGEMQFVWTGYESDEEISRLYRVKESKSGCWFKEHDLEAYAVCCDFCANRLIDTFNEKSKNEREQNMTKEEKEVHAREKEILEISTTKIRYRITGPQSIHRLKPLLHGLRGVSCAAVEDVTLTTSSSAAAAAAVDRGPPSDVLDFVWETACKITERQQHLST